MTREERGRWVGRKKEVDDRLNIIASDDQDRTRTGMALRVLGDRGVLPSQEPERRRRSPCDAEVCLSYFNILEYT